jgi:hypothetical protein
LAELIVVKDIDVAIPFHRHERQVTSFGHILQDVLDAGIAMKPFHVDALIKNFIYENFAMSELLTVNGTSLTGSDYVGRPYGSTGCLASVERAFLYLPHILVEFEHVGDGDN